MRSLLRDRRSAQGGSCNTAETEQRRGARPRVARVVRGRTDRSMRSKYAFSPAAVRPAVSSSALVVCAGLPVCGGALKPGGRKRERERAAHYEATGTETI